MKVNEIFETLSKGYKLYNPSWGSRWVQLRGEQGYDSSKGVVSPSEVVDILLVTPGEIEEYRPQYDLDLVLSYVKSHLTKKIECSVGEDVRRFNVKSGEYEHTERVLQGLDAKGTSYRIHIYLKSYSIRDIVYWKLYIGDRFTSHRSYKRSDCNDEHVAQLILETLRGGPFCRSYTGGVEYGYHYEDGVAYVILTSVGDRVEGHGQSLDEALMDLRGKLAGAIDQNKDSFYLVPKTPKTVLSSSYCD